MKYKCLVLDHDDTVVDSTKTIHYPCLIEYLKTARPNQYYTLEEVMKLHFNPGAFAFFKDIVGLNEKEMKEETDFWNDYVSKHIPKAFKGIKEILDTHKQNGGIITVVSHSFSQNIIRDYKYNDLPKPDIVFGWDLPDDKRKPSSYPLKEIMNTFNLQPQDLLMVDDLKPGFDMAKKVDIDFAACGWSYDIEEIESFMRKNSDYYFKTIKEFKEFLNY